MGIVNTKYNFQSQDMHSKLRKPKGKGTKTSSESATLIEAQRGQRGSEPRRAKSDTAFSDGRRRCLPVPVWSESGPSAARLRSSVRSRVRRQKGLTVTLGDWGDACRRRGRREELFVSTSHIKSSLISLTSFLVGTFFCVKAFIFVLFCPKVAGASGSRWRTKRVGCSGTPAVLWMRSIKVDR